MIGHLQSNKVGKLLESAAQNLVIQTVDKPKLAEKLNAKCASLGRTVEVMI
jgi:uncharacterized pyridoxal phosphate-containing UPF0001 family protein